MAIYHGDIMSMDFVRNINLGIQRLLHVLRINPHVKKQ